MEQFQIKIHQMKLQIFGIYNNITRTQESRGICVHSGQNSVLDAHDWVLREKKHYSGMERQRCFSSFNAQNCSTVKGTKI